MELGRAPQIGTDSIGTSVLMADILSQDKGYLSECSENGTILMKDKNKLINQLTDLGGRLAYRYINLPYDIYVWIWNDSMIDCQFSGAASVSITVSSQSEDFVHNVKKIVSPYFQQPVKQGQVYAIVQQGSQLALSAIGNAGIPLIAGNYSPQVIEDYRFVINDLNSTVPSGRITIMEGEPGTGKTHIVRGLLMEVKDAMFVLVSPDMVSSLGGPELLPLLVNYHRHQTGPIILILEDADKCLVARDGDNMNSIQSLLNLGDGILGSLLDLRIIATTNAKELEMEPAIMRKGRLSRRLRVGSVDSATAMGIFSRLLPNIPVSSKLLTSNRYTLAEVYSIAREAGWLPQARSLAEDDDAKDPNDVFDQYDEEDTDY